MANPRAPATPSTIPASRHSQRFGAAGGGLEIDGGGEVGAAVFGGGEETGETGAAGFAITVGSGGGVAAARGSGAGAGGLTGAA